MPAAAMAAGAVDRQLALCDISAALRQLILVPPPPDTEAS
jgi:hypothetical protein